MSVTYLTIPKQLKVGFNNSNDPLAYVTYVKSDGSIAKETSWNSWRRTNTTILDFENTPTTGFKLKGWGGGHRWTRRQAYCQIVDPRGFEFQISYENLMFILLTDSCIEGTLSGSYVYGWDNVNLVLTSIKSEDYIYSSKIINDVQRFNPKECTVGHTYYYPKTPDDKLIYLGQFPYVNCIFKEDPSDWRNRYSGKGIVKIKIENRYIFKKIKKTYNTFDCISASLPENKKLVCLDNIPQDESLIQQYINEYYNQNTTNVHTLTTKKITDIKNFNIIGKDITEEIQQCKVYPKDEWTDEFMRSGKLHLYKDQYIYYVSDDNRLIYHINIFKACILPRYNTSYSYELFSQYGYLYKQFKTDEERYKYLKEKGEYQLIYTISTVYEIAEDNSCIKRIPGDSSDVFKIDELPSNGKIIVTEDKKGFTAYVTLSINDDREIKFSNIYI